MLENPDKYQEKLNFANSTVGRMLKNVKKRTSTRLSFEETVLILELVGFAIQQMRTVLEEEIAGENEEQKQ